MLRFQWHRNVSKWYGTTAEDRDAYLYFLPVWDDYMQIAAAKPGAPWARLPSSLACFGHRRSLRSSRPRWNITAILRPSDTVTQQSIARA